MKVGCLVLKTWFVEFRGVKWILKADTTLRIVSQNLEKAKIRSNIYFLPPSCFLVLRITKMIRWFRKWDTKESLSFRRFRCILIHTRHIIFTYWEINKKKMSKYRQNKKVLLIINLLFLIMSAGARCGVGACVFFFIFRFLQAWYTFNLRWNSIRQASSNSRSK